LEKALQLTADGRKVPGLDLHQALGLDEIYPVTLHAALADIPGLAVVFL
jgi:hypothetical protein